MSNPYQLAEPKSILDESSIPSNTLETCIKAFQKRQESNVSQYLDQLKRRAHIKENALFVLHGYSQVIPVATEGLSDLLLHDKERRTSGGYYLRWNGKGIVINPGPHFLEQFHRKGLHVRDIDYVIVTNAHPDAYADIKEIYNLNYHLNNSNTELQIIHYYLSPKAYQVLSHVLKPHFKQEKDSVRCLELFLDSPEIEKVELTDGISLHYFPVNHYGLAAPENAAHVPSHLGIRLELSNPHFKPVRIGYLSGASWSPLLSNHLEHCDIVIAGFGSTSANDYSKLKYNETCLGYYGSFSLIEDINPQLFIVSEFNGNQGDIRLEVTRMLRQEFAKTYPNHEQAPTILPADSTLLIDLSNLHIQCSISKSDTPPRQARVVKSQAVFGSLKYVAPSCFA